MASFVEFWQAEDHKNEFLKEVLGETALTWVKEKNVEALELLGEPSKNQPMYDKVLSILDSKDKIPYISLIRSKQGNLCYNFWKDSEHILGIWRRTSLTSYRTAAPEWETVLDLDALGAQESEKWVWKGHVDYDPIIRDASTPSRTFIVISRGGSDASVYREFDLDSCQFVSAAEPCHGFVLPEAKSRVAWKDLNTVLLGTDMKDDGASLTDSGYPRTVREWTRGTDYKDSLLVFEGEKSDVAVSQYVSRHATYSYEMRSRSITFYTSQKAIFLPEKQLWHELELLPLDASLGLFKTQFLVQLRSDWVLPAGTTPQGSLLAVDIAEFVTRGLSASFTVLFSPTPTCSLQDYTPTRDFLIIESMETVKSRLAFWKFKEEEGKTGSWEWVGHEEQPVVRGCGTSALDAHESNAFWLTLNSFLVPTTLAIGDASLGVASIQAAEAVKSLPIMFDASELVEEQYEAVSEDGTRVPYFMVRHKDMLMDGSTPTLLYGYGGFEISLTPSYLSTIGASWLDHRANGQHTCYVNANIRGGGEFGPKWHQAALKENRKLAYDDFIAVAEDLVQRKFTTPAKLGIRGGSNGGLLMGNMLVRRPDLFAAVCCAVPLLDMKTYHTLLAGASWTGEYGNPDTEDWSFLQRYSAYHNIDPAAVKARKYPALLMTTSTRDDRVHPFHARSFVKRLADLLQEEQQSCTDLRNSVIYYENIEGGHAGAADNKQTAFMNVLYVEFLRKILF